ncbi:DUF4224 domain-containing protein [Halomonas elongata]|uniref:DUF4224 domain-containing protein n=1 Tax=Halomonas elongata (strain ATCC 33173 / DSM 2581 / NBRC 15536 / NCIMB 2198 / 1H9) TaxID=768066 RepID=A0ABZ0T952_HALED|nr:DUF4224 domain-containing protein [Halomonas elongata]RAW05938.1 DUF4224 domain-containing protein [Halomonas elongata]WBF19264.1 DUF4224 domain-containing protein [Halomonas elongata]WPU48124.1 DUF4224 domain-containing protein [Halomonas elongata DSM 2581]
MELVLSRKEVRELTGCAQRARQRQHLDAMGIPYVVRADGWPVIDRQAYHQAMGCEAANDAGHPKAVLNLEALDG